MDQGVKFFVINNMSLNESIDIVKNFFSITYIHNDGAAFGIMAGKSLFLIGLPVIMIVGGILVLALMKNKLHKIEKISVALIIGGGIGNLIDRVIYGYVVDFLDFKVWDPIFNVADVLVCVGCGLLIVYLLFIEGRQNGKRKENRN